MVSNNSSGSCVRNQAEKNKLSLFDEDGETMSRKSIKLNHKYDCVQNQAINWLGKWLPSFTFCLYLLIIEANELTPLTAFRTRPAPN